MKGRAWIVVLAVGCSSPGEPAPSASAATASVATASATLPTPSAAAATSDSDAVVALFADMGDRTAAAIKRVSETKPRSKVAYAEALALATPAGFATHSDLIEKHGLDQRRFSAVMADQAARERALAAMQAKLEPLVKDLDAAKLPEVDPTDCTALARRLLELRAGGPSKAPLGQALAPIFADCATVVPKNVSDCLGAKPATVEAFDRCVAGETPTVSSSTSAARP